MKKSILLFLIIFSIVNVQYVMAQEKITQTAGHVQLGEFAPKFAELNDDVLFGEVWNRPGLSPHDRSMVTVATLIGKGIIDSSLAHHLEFAKQNGVTRTEISEMLTHIAFYAGWPNAWGAFRLAKDVWAEDVAADDNGKTDHATKGGGQMLVCVAGRGWYQEEGRPAVQMLPGDVIHIPANVKHWHGAAADSWFAHLAFEVPGENTSNEWLEPVTDEEYDKLEK